MEQYSNIKHIRLINGDDIIANVHSVMDDQIYIQSPLLLEEVFESSGSSKTVLIDFLPFSNIKECSINKNSVIMSVDINENFRSYYLMSIQIAKRNSDKAVKDVNEVNNNMKEYLTDDFDEYVYQANTIH